MRALAALALLAIVPLGGCGQTAEEKRAEALAAEPVITPGIYGDVRISGETGDYGGMELRLDEGSSSAMVEFVHCEGWCNMVERRALRRGLGGLSFTLDGNGLPQPVDLTIQPDGADAVVVSVDWGSGLQQRRLPRIRQEMGLALARSEMAAGDSDTGAGDGR